MHQLELQFVMVAELRVLRLAAEQRLGLQINFVIQRAFAVHDGVKLFSVHGYRSSLRLIGKNRSGKNNEDTLCVLSTTATRLAHQRSEFPDGRAGSAESPISLRWLFTSRSV